MTCRRRLAPALSMLACGVCLLSDASGSAQSVQTAHLVQVGVIPAAADKVEVGGNHAYLVTGRTLAIFDISNPGTPKREGEYTFPDKIWAIEVVGTLVYAAVDKFGLGIVDVSNVSAPKLRGSLKTPGQSKSIALTGSMVMVADHMSGVNFIDVSDPAKPVFLDDFFLDGYARAVAARGPIAAAVDAPTGLYVFDFSKPGKLEPVGIRQSADRPGNVRMSDPNAAPGLKIAVLLGGGSLQIYDIADPAAPAKAATFRTPGARAHGCRSPRQAGVRGGRRVRTSGRRPGNAVQAENRRGIQDDDARACGRRCEYIGLGRCGDGRRRSGRFVHCRRRPGADSRAQAVSVSSDLSD